MRTGPSPPSRGKRSATDNGAEAGVRSQQRARVDLDGHWAPGTPGPTLVPEHLVLVDLGMFMADQPRSLEDSLSRAAARGAAPAVMPIHLPSVVPAPPLPSLVSWTRSGSEAVAQYTSLPQLPPFPQFQPRLTGLVPVAGAFRTRTIKLETNGTYSLIEKRERERVIRE